VVANAGSSPREVAVPLPVLALLLLLSLGWAGQPVSMKLSFTHVPPMATAGLRFAIGLLLIGGCALAQGIPLAAPRREWRRLLAMGALFCVQICLLYLGGNLTTAGYQSLLINTHPLFVPLLAHRFLKGDRLTRTKVAGSGVAFLGFVVAMGGVGALGAEPPPPTMLAGNLLLLGSAVLLAAKAVYTAALVRDIEPYRVLFWQMVLAVPIFLALSPLIDGPQPWRWSPVAALAIAYQGVVVAGFCFVVWTYLLRRYAPSRLAVVMFATPVFGVALGAGLLGERVTPGLVIGGVLVLAGIALVNRESWLRPREPL